MMYDLTVSKYVSGYQHISLNCSRGRCLSYVSYISVTLAPDMAYLVKTMIANIGHGKCKEEARNMKQYKFLAATVSVAMTALLTLVIVGSISHASAAKSGAAHILMSQQQAQPIPTGGLPPPNGTPGTSGTPGPGGPPGGGIPPSGGANPSATTVPPIEQPPAEPNMAGMPRTGNGTGETMLGLLSLVALGLVVTVIGVVSRFATARKDNRL